MKLGRVVGNVVATRKDDRLIGHKLLIVRLLSPKVGGDLGPSVKSESFMVAVDMVGAGIGEDVILCFGSSAAKSSGVPDAPIDGAIVGIVDSADVDPKEVG